MLLWIGYLNKHYPVWVLLVYKVGLKRVENRNLIKAERSGKWNGYLTKVEPMILYFDESRHFNYAKSAGLYVQDI